MYNTISIQFLYTKWNKIEYKLCKNNQNYARLY